jgi:CMP-2-keto-3-deoxyoctulosonic acid synthetase
MKIIGSVIARAGSKRLPYKNLLPFKGIPLARRAILQRIESKLFSTVVLSTDSELIARTCMDIDGLSILKRPESLAGDNIASIPVFQHIVENFACDIHLNYNCNFPDCPNEVFRQAITITEDFGEALSDPYAVWAQSANCLRNYGNPFDIKAKVFNVSSVNPIDIHTEDDLLSVHQSIQGPLSW